MSRRGRILALAGKIRSYGSFPLAVKETNPAWDDISQPYARGAGLHGPVGKPNSRQLRRWSRTNPWIRAAINLRRRQVAMAPFDVVPELKSATRDDAKADAVVWFLHHPNPKGDSWRSFIEPIVEDTIVLDQGCWENEATIGGKLGLGAGAPIKWLWYVDGASIRVDPNWDGTEPAKPRYFQYDESGFLLQSFVNSELTMVMEQPTTYQALGISALEVLAQTIESDLSAAEYNRKMVKEQTPPGIIDLGEGIRPDQVDSFRAYWDAEIAGKSQVAITGGSKSMKWTALAQSNADMQFQEWQVYLARKICAVLGVQPQDIGIGFDVNKANGQTASENTEDRGINPLLDLFASYMTREVVSRMLPGYKFVFTDMGKEDQARADAHYAVALGGVSWVRPNDALAERGQDGIGPVGDELWVKTPSGPVPMSLYLDGLVNPPAPPPAPAAPAPAADGASGDAAPVQNPDEPAIENPDMPPDDPESDGSKGVRAPARRPFSRRNLAEFYAPRQ